MTHIILGLTPTYECRTFSKLKFYPSIRRYSGKKFHVCSYITLSCSSAPLFCGILLLKVCGKEVSDAQANLPLPLATNVQYVGAGVYAAVSAVPYCFSRAEPSAWHEAGA